MGLKKLFDVPTDDLKNTVKNASQKYYSGEDSGMTDEEFDAVEDELRRRGDTSVDEVGKGYDVKKDSTIGTRCPHRYGIVGSLSKCRKWSEIIVPIRTRMNDTWWAVSLKLDGLSAVLYYKNGYMEQALTRGDGTTGIDITDKIRYICAHRGYRLDTCDGFTGAVRGEILMKFADFEKLHEIHPEYSNPRNTAAGLINGDEITENFDYLDFRVYTVIGDETNSLGLQATPDSSRMGRVVEWLHEHFDNTAPYSFILPCKDDESLQERMATLRDDWYGTYPADGIVITSGVSHVGADVDYIACAFKFPSEKKQTTIRDVIWKMSKTGYAIPKFQYDPIELAGTTCQYATAFNAEYIKQNDLGIGSEVVIEKRGEIIPNVVEVITPTEPGLISKCPDCGADLVWKGVHLYCPNEDCPSKMIQDTLVWIMSLTPTFGMGEILIENFINQLVDAEVIKDTSIESIMNADIAELDVLGTGIQVDVFKELINNLQTRVFTIEAAYNALNIPRLGNITSRKLANRGIEIFDKLCNWANEEDNFTFSTIKSELIDTFGESTTASIFNHKKKVRRLKFIQTRVVVPKMTRSMGKVAITGKLSVKRSEFEQVLKEYGWEVGEIKKDTNYLITDDPTSNSSKNKKADQWGIEKITEEDFGKRFLK